MSNYKGILIAKQQLKGKIYSGVVKEYPELESLEVIPLDEEQNLISNKYGFKEVKVKPVDITELSEYKESLAISNQILNKEK